MHRIAHRGQVDDRRHAGEVLEEDATRGEGDLLRRLRARHPAGDSRDVGLRDALAVLHAQDVLQEDAQRVRQAQDVVSRLQRLEAEDLVSRAGDLERGTCAEAVRMRHISIQPDVM